MNFLQPVLLAALPLVSLPIIIHLINQRRYQTIHWAAMMFLLTANRMSRGHARLRRWLILLFRMLVVAGLIMAASRPLSSGWLGFAGGGPVDTTIVLLDRSPSMQQLGAGIATSKLETGRLQLTQALSKLNSQHWVLIESATMTPRELESPQSLLELPSTAPASAAADLPALLRAAHDYLAENQTGRAEVWICSDLRANDWDDRSSRWQALRDAFQQFPQGIRFNLLAYPDVAERNYSIRVTQVQRVATEDGFDLLVSLQLSRRGAASAAATMPIQFEIDGARSQVNVEMVGPEYELKDYRIALGPSQQRGWGRVSLPADSNPSDNEFYFSFDEPAPRRTLLVAEDVAHQRPLELAAAISPDPTLQSQVEVIDRAQLATVQWEQTALVLWQGRLPENDEVLWLTTFVDNGGRLFFFPPETVGSGSCFGVRWQGWEQAANDLLVETWRSDQDLLRRTQSGAALPVGDLKIQRYCRLEGQFTPLAELKSGMPLLARVTTNRGGVYFWTTRVGVGDSSLATDGVVLYVSLQRALAEGAAELSGSRQIIAGTTRRSQSGGWQKLAGRHDAMSTQFSEHAGVYRAGEELLAVNRPAAETQAEVLSSERLDALFGDLDFVRVNDRAGNLNSLVQEVWRLFLLVMMLAMIVEAGLCLPKLRSAAVRAAAGTAVEIP